MYTGRFVVLGDGEVEVADDALVLLELQLSPLAVVHELLQGLLQVLEDALVSAFHLLAVDVDFHLQLLSLYRDDAGGCQNQYDEQYLSHLLFLIKRCKGSANRMKNQIINIFFKTKERKQLVAVSARME